MKEHPASGALRARSPQRLHQELVADLWDGEKEWLKDFRDLMLVLAPYHDCARRLGLDVAATFRHAEREGPHGLREVVTEFGARDDVTPQNFGYTVLESAEGPSYRLS